jgi:hypothetical protein
MKQKASPTVIAVAVVALIGALALMYRFFFPPMPPPDTANPKGMPIYAQQFLKNRKAMESRGGPQPERPGGSQPGGAVPGH